MTQIRFPSYGAYAAFVSPIFTKGVKIMVIYTSIIMSVKRIVAFQTPEELHVQIQRACKTDGYFNKSEWIRQACREKVERSGVKVR